MRSSRETEKRWSNASTSGPYPAERRRLGTNGVKSQSWPAGTPGSGGDPTWTPRAVSAACSRASNPSGCVPIGRSRPSRTPRRPRSRVTSRSCSSVSHCTNRWYRSARAGRGSKVARNRAKAFRPCVERTNRSYARRRPVGALEKSSSIRSTTARFSRATARKSTCSRRSSSSTRRRNSGRRTQARARGDRRNSGVRMGSRNTSFQNRTLIARYGLGSNGRSRNTGVSGRVMTAEAPCSAAHRPNDRNAVKSPHPQVPDPRRAYSGTKNPQPRDAPDEASRPGDASRCSSRGPVGPSTVSRWTPVGSALGRVTRPSGRRGSLRTTGEPCSRRETVRAPEVERATAGGSRSVRRPGRARTIGSTVPARASRSRRRSAAASDDRRSRTPEARRSRRRVDEDARRVRRIASR